MMALSAKALAFFTVCNSSQLQLGKAAMVVNCACWVSQKACSPACQGPQLNKLDVCNMSAKVQDCIF